MRFVFGSALPAILPLIGLAFCIYLAVRSGDPGWIKRGGALLTALAVSLLLVHWAVEKMHSAVGHHPEDKAAPPPPDAEATGLVTKLARKLRMRKEQQRKRQLGRWADAIIILHCLLAILGEVLHGVGDIGFCLLTMELDLNTLDDLAGLGRKCK